MKRKLLNTEIADFIFEEMRKKNYEVKYDEILEAVDDSIGYNSDYEIDENGEIKRELSEEEIKTLKENMLYGTEEYYYYKAEIEKADEAEAESQEEEYEEEEEL